MQTIYTEVALIDNEYRCEEAVFYNKNPLTPCELSDFLLSYGSGAQSLVGLCDWFVRDVKLETHAP